MCLCTLMHYWNIFFMFISVNCKCISVNSNKKYLFSLNSLVDDDHYQFHQLQKVSECFWPTEKSQCCQKLMHQQSRKTAECYLLNTVNKYGQIDTKQQCLHMDRSKLRLNKADVKNWSVFDFKQIYRVDLTDGKYMWRKIIHDIGSAPSARDKLSCWVYNGR